MNALVTRAASGKATGWVIALLVVVAIIGIGAFYYVSTYNTLVTLDEGVKAAWGDVETTYQRRADLIPNLVATVKGAKDFESSTLQAVVEARAKVGQVQVDAAKLGDAAAMQNFQQAQSQLSSALSRLLVVVERYPALKATENFRDLQVQLEGTENRINVARTRYNEAARAYNRKRRGFFARVVADRNDFGEVQYFKADEGATSAPAVTFD